MDDAWRIDLTKVKRGWVLIVIDDSTRKVVHWHIKTSPHGGNSFTSKDVVDNLTEGMHSYQRPFVLQTDSGGQFLTPLFKQFLQEQGVTHSLGNASKQRNHNQVIERFNRTLKANLKKKAKVYFNLSAQSKDFKWTRNLSDNEISKWIQEVILEFNDKPHNHSRGASPIEMETALVGVPLNQSYLPMLAAESSEGLSFFV